jgi:tetratricopeptide (TPR) repeat protein
MKWIEIQYNKLKETVSRLIRKNITILFILVWLSIFLFIADDIESKKIFAWPFALTFLLYLFVLMYKDTITKFSYKDITIETKGIADASGDGSYHFGSLRDSFIFLGNKYRSDGNYKEALINYVHADSINKSILTSFLILYCYVKEKNPKKAFEWFYKLKVKTKDEPKNLKGREHFAEYFGELDEKNIKDLSSIVKEINGFIEYCKKYNLAGKSINKILDDV